jgi:hypothetical protein
MPDGCSTMPQRHAMPDAPHVKYPHLLVHVRSYPLLSRHPQRRRRPRDTQTALVTDDKSFREQYLLNCTETGGTVVHSVTEFCKTDTCPREYAAQIKNVTQSRAICSNTLIVNVHP